MNFRMCSGLFFTLIISSLILQAEVEVPASGAADTSVAPALTADEVRSILKLELQKQKDEQSNAVKFTGETRYRHQTENVKNREERRSHRLMARFGVTAEPEKDMKVFLRLQTTTAATSANQVLGDGKKSPSQSRRSFGLDWSYGQYFFRILEQEKKQNSILMGKMKSPFIFAGQNQIIMDRDISPEGVALDLNFNLPTDSITDFKNSISAKAGSFWIREAYDSSLNVDQPDQFLNIAQLTYQAQYKSYSLNVILGIFSYTSMKDTTPLFLNGENTIDVLVDNTTDSVSGNYLYNFDIDQAGLELKYKSADIPLESTLFYEQMKNIDADKLNKASVAGVRLQSGDWTLSYATQDVERDSVVRLFTDSDFAGGQTASNGSVLSLSYKINPHLWLLYTQYDNKFAVDTTTPQDYRRTHIDLTANF